MRSVYCFLVLIASCLSGCLTEYEEVIINEDGSGVYKPTIDFSDEFSLFESVNSDTISTDPVNWIGKRDMDTVIYLSSISDFNKMVLEQEGGDSVETPLESDEILDSATVRIKVNLKKRSIISEFNYPFQNISDVADLIEMHQQIIHASIASAAFKDGVDIIHQEDQFDFHIRDGLIERKVKTPLVQEFKKSNGMKKLNKLKEFRNAPDTRSVYILPRPAQNIEGKNLTVSPDRKQITVTTNFKDIYNQPEKFSFRIEY